MWQCASHAEITKLCFSLDVRDSGHLEEKVFGEAGRGSNPRLLKKRNNIDIGKSVRRQADGQVRICGSEEKTMSVTLHTQMGIVSGFLRKSFFPFDPFCLITTFFSLRLTFWYSCKEQVIWHARTPDGPVSITHNTQTSSTTVNKTSCYLTQEGCVFNANILSLSVFKISPPPASSPPPPASRPPLPPSSQSVFAPFAAVCNIYKSLRLPHHLTTRHGPLTIQARISPSNE